MKRLLAIFCLFALILCLAGCADEPTPATAVTTDPTTTAATDPTDPTAATTEVTTPTEATTMTTEVTTAATKATTAEKPTTVTTAKPTTAVRPLGKKIYGANALFLDPNRADGMYYTYTESSQVKGRLSYNKSTMPHWLFTQEGSRYDISKGTFTTPSAGVFRYEDTASLLELNTNDGSYRVGIDGSKIFETPRTAADPIAGAVLSPKGLAAEVNVRDMTHLYTTLDFILEKTDNKLPEEDEDLGLHTAQWNYYVFVQDRNSSDWFYVGLPLYDIRFQAGNYISTDPGTGGVFVYIPAVEDVYGDDFVEVGRRFCYSVDMLPFIEDAFAEAQKRGFFPSRSLDTFFISGCNLGWEVTSAIDCMATVYEFSMSYDLK